MQPDLASLSPPWTILHCAMANQQGRDLGLDGGSYADQHAQGLTHTLNLSEHLHGI